MRVLTFTGLAGKMLGYTYNYEHRIVTIVFFLISCDIYQGNHAILRTDKSETETAEARLLQGCSQHTPPGFQLALFSSGEYHQYAEKDQHFSIGIPFLLKPGFDSYPPDSICKPYSLTGIRRSHKAMISPASFIIDRTKHFN